MQLIHAPAANAFIYEQDGKDAYVTYEIYEGRFDVRKTFVPEEMRGQAHLLSFADTFSATTQISLTSHHALFSAY